MAHQHHFRFFCLLWVLFFGMPATAQVHRITGRIVDAETLDPLPYAHVFIDQTTIGAVSDFNGEYTIENIEDGEYKLVFSFVGYELYYKVATINGQDARVSARLTPQKETLQNVEVKGTRDKEWEHQLKQFNRVFFGNSKQADDCKILNPWVLEFEYNKVVRKFIATASAPLEIENRSLGYHITCNLQSFSFDKKTYKIRGLYKFEEINTVDAREAARWTRNRKQAYQASMRFLMKSIIEHHAAENGFALYVDNRPETYTHSGFFSTELEKANVTALKLNDWVVPSGKPGYYNVKFDKRLEIHHTTEFANTKTYRDIPYPVSWIEVEKGPLLVSATGFVVNNDALVTSGELNENRVAAMLPLNYSPGSFVVVNYLTKRNMAKRLQERSYIQTDKSVYYSGEHIWFKAHTNYANQSVRDSLSKVLYVDLLNKTGDIIQSKILKIDSLGARGEFQITSTIKPGQLYLRAYTRWMLNYGSSVIGYVPILISDNKLKTTLTPIDNSEENDFILNIRMNGQDSSNLWLALDSTMQTEPAVCAISIAPVGSTNPNELKRLKEFMFFDDNLPDDALPDFVYPFEYGFNLQGKVRNQKKRPIQADMTIMQGKMDSLYMLRTDRKGRFTIQDLSFYDSTRFSIHTTVKKKKNLVKAELLPDLKPAPNIPTIKKNYSIDTLSVPNPISLIRPSVDSLHMAEKAGQIHDQDATTSIHADHVLTSEQLEKMPAGQNIITALAGRIPGLQFDPSGRSISLRGSGQNNNGSEPLFVIDGIPLLVQQATKTTQIEIQAQPLPQQAQANNESQKYTLESQTTGQNSITNVTNMPAEGLDGNSAVQILGHITVSAVSRVEVFTRMDPRYGSLGSSGVISIYTKRLQGKSPGKAFDSYSVPGFSKPQIFKQAINYSDNSFEEYAPTWYWNSDVKVSAKEFTKLIFPTLPKGILFQITIAGITKSGKTVTGRFLINSGLAKPVQASLDQRQK